MFGKIILGSLIIAGGLGMIIYTDKVKSMTGPIGFAESWFGLGGTYTFLKLLGLGIMIGSFMWMTGTLDKLIPDFITNQGIAPTE